MIFELVMQEPPLPDPLEAGWEGEPVCEVMEETDQIRALRCSFPPGGGHERHTHAPHFGYMLTSGTIMQITDETGTRVSNPSTAGTSWWSDGNTHEVLNVGDVTGVYLIIEPKQIVAQEE